MNIDRRCVRYRAIKPIQLDAEFARLRDGRRAMVELMTRQNQLHRDERSKREP